MINLMMMMMYHIHVCMYVCLYVMVVYIFFRNRKARLVVLSKGFGQ